MDELAIAFAMRCDDQNLSFERGLRAAEELAGEIMEAAEDREAMFAQIAASSEEQS